MTFPASGSLSGGKSGLELSSPWPYAPRCHSSHHLDNESHSLLQPESLAENTASSEMVSITEMFESQPEPGLGTKRTSG